MNPENIIPYQPNLFEDNDCGSLNYFDELLNQIPYAKLVHTLDEERKGGRNDWPNEALIRCWFAKFHFKHKKVQQLIDELERNPSLRIACHIQPLNNKKDRSKSLAPSASVFTRFQKRLMRHQELLDEIFETMTEDIRDDLPSYGKSLALDGKLIDAYSHGKSKKDKPDGRRDTDANYTKKTYVSVDKNGKLIEKSQWHFGYRVHLIVDTNYELPVRYEVTKASLGEKTVAKQMVCEFPSWLAKRADHLSADKGYDGGKLREYLEDREIKPVIDIINHWKKEKTRQYKNTDFVYTYDGKIYYVTEKGAFVRAQYKGYHKASDTLRYETHPKDGVGKHLIQIKREEDPRVFNVIGRDSKKFQRYYNERTSVERVNGRIDRDYLFEDNQIRGLKKMNLHVSTMFILMLANKKVELARKQNCAA